MSWYRLVLCILFLPAAALAGTNPFSSNTAQNKNTDPNNVFTLSSVGPAHVRAVARHAEGLPPPILSLNAVLLSYRSSALKQKETPAASPARSSEQKLTCSLGMLPQVPLEDGIGGDVTIRFSRAESKCIMGIEAQNTWLQIGFFNGRELRVHISRNRTDKPRTGVLIFASMNDSQQMQVNQAGLLQGEIAR